MKTLEAGRLPPIPDTAFPDVPSGPILGVDELLTDLRAEGFEVISVYYERKLPGAVYDCLARESVARLLKEAQKRLPEGWRFVILDAYRPIPVQKALWEEYRGEVARRYPELPEAEADRKAELFVSRPSYDPLAPSLHNTGGAVDLTIRDSGGNILDMGTGFDEFREASSTGYYERPGMSAAVRDNRRLLYHAMLSAGFTNLPSEWWHYDYGTRFWAFFKGETALYRGIVGE